MTTNLNEPRTPLATARSVPGGFPAIDPLGFRARSCPPLGHSPGQMDAVDRPPTRLDASEGRF